MKPVKRVPRDFARKKANLSDAFLEELKSLREYADRYRKPNGGKLTDRERQHLFMTGKLPGSAVR